VPSCAASVRFGQRPGQLGRGFFVLHDKTGIGHWNPPQVGACSARSRAASFARYFVTGFRAYVTATELHFGRLLFPRQLVANLEENPNEETRFRRRCRRSRHRFCLARARGRRSANDQECLREGPHEVGRDHQDLFEGQHVALLGC